MGQISFLEPKRKVPTIPFYSFSPPLVAERERESMAITVPRRQLFIGGQWTEPVLRKTLPVVNPATEDIIGTFYFFQSYLVLLTF